MELFKNVFGQGSLILENYALHVAKGNYEHAGFKAKLGLKDLRLALSAADQLEVPLPIASLVRDQLLERGGNRTGRARLGRDCANRSQARGALRVVAWRRRARSTLARKFDGKRRALGRR